LFKYIFKNSPGPKTVKEMVTLGCKGFLMGCADTVPGISGGTIAYLTGIYTDLLNAINSIDKTFFAHLKQFELKAAFTHIHTKFLVILLLGILTAIGSMTRLVVYCLENYADFTFSLFFGFMLASILIVYKELKSYHLKNLLVLVFTSALTFWLVGKTPSAGSGDLSYFYVLICGCIAICAMLLPGLSGSYLLMLLGAYHSILASVKEVTDPGNWLNGFKEISSLSPPFILATFLLGCIIGIKSFSRLLSYLLKNHHQLMVSFICGLMIGAMRAIWPWQSRPDFKHGTALETPIIEYRLPLIDQNFAFAVVLCLIGFALVIWMESAFNKNANSKTV